MNIVTTITWLTFHEARRRRMVLVALVLGLLFVTLFGVGFFFIHREAQQDAVSAVVSNNIYNFFLMAGLYVVHFLTIMIAIFSSVDTISGEIASHTIQAIATRPVRRWQIVLGKWLGYAAMISLYLVLLAGGILLVVYVIAGYIPPQPSDRAAAADTRSTGACLALAAWRHPLFYHDQRCHTLSPLRAGVYRGMGRADRLIAPISSRHSYWHHHQLADARGGTLAACRPPDAANHCA